MSFTLKINPAGGLIFFVLASWAAWQHRPWAMAASFGLAFFFCCLVTRDAADTGAGHGE